MTAPVASKTPPPEANPPSNPPPDRRPPDNRPPRTPPADRRPPSSLAEALDTLDLLFRSMQVLDARELRTADPASRMRLTYALDLGRRAVADLKSPARRDLVDSGADPTAIARSGGPVRSTRATPGEEPTPGSGPLLAEAVTKSAVAVVARSAGDNSRAGRPPAPGAGTFSLPEPNAWTWSR